MLQDTFSNEHIRFLTNIYVGESISCLLRVYYITKLNNHNKYQITKTLIENSKQLERVFR